ncbi:MAG: thioredoxin domain-containing protein [Armatimonadota bacterium]
MSRNRLTGAASPYLRQHADNPVWWQPWDEEAFRQAQQEGKPIFLSIGYSACHWCHVMEHESFEDSGVADLLNEHFVCIKVDREERPDVDDAYMTALQLTQGSGGWPLSAFLTPTGEPFFLGTYFPPEDRGDYPGFRTLLHSVIRAWTQERAKLEAAARELARAVEEANRMAIAPSALSPEDLEQAIRTTLSRFDREQGGFLGSPKFPPHSSLLLHLDLLENTNVGERSDSREFVERTLEGMMLGGIRDHVGGGFHRYSTDGEWHLPHFEKMLYDNALLLEAYARAGRLGERQDFLEVAEETAQFLVREMTAPDGTLYSAIDADSEGSEGAFYVWTTAEVRQTLGDSAEEFIKAYGLTDEGNFREEATGHRSGANVLHAQARLGTRFHRELEALRAVRESRQRPALDDKRLIAWNGLAIRALAVAGHSDAARRCADAWLSRDPLPHQLSGDRALGVPFLDVAYFVHALVTLGSEYANAARDVYATLSQRLRSEAGWTLSAAEHNSPLGRSVPVLDSALPSAYGYAVLCSLALGEVESASRDVGRVSGWMVKAPGATATLWRAFVALSQADGVARGEPAPIPKVILFPKTAEVTDGRAEYTVTVEAPEGWHVQAGVSLEVDGLSGVEVRHVGESGWQSASLKFSGEPPAGEEGEARALLRFQVCTDRECLPAEEVEIPLAWRR